VVIGLIVSRPFHLRQGYGGYGRGVICNVSIFGKTNEKCGFFGATFFVLLPNQSGISTNHHNIPTFLRAFFLDIE